MHNCSTIVHETNEFWPNKVCPVYYHCLSFIQHHRVVVYEGFSIRFSPTSARIYWTVFWFLKSFLYHKYANFLLQPGNESGQEWGTVLKCQHARKKFSHDVFCGKKSLQYLNGLLCTLAWHSTCASLAFFIGNSVAQKVAYPEVRLWFILSRVKASFLPCKKWA